MIYYTIKFCYILHKVIKIFQVVHSIELRYKIKLCTISFQMQTHVFIYVH